MLAGQLSPDTNSGVRIGYRLAPTTGANDVIVTYSGTGTFTSGASVLTGVHQTVPVGATFGANGTSTAVSLGVTDSVSGDLVIDAAGTGSGFSAKGAGQTGIHSAAGWINVNENSSGGNGASSYEAGAVGTVTMSWTVGNDQWQISAVAFKAAAGGPFPPWRPRLQVM
jgi:hypothetical protein